ncbi:hypothetical protein B7463_g2743, partial [Scytalidium lignicola]
MLLGLPKPLLLLVSLTAIATAAAIPPVSFTIKGDSRLTSRAAGTSAASQLLAIAPTSANCDGAPAPSECATATQAAPYLINAMGSYNITSASEIAALLSLIAYETDDFKYNINHYPGNPGQGTRNMQMASYNLMYAQSISELQQSLASITTASTTGGLSSDQLNDIRALVLPDQYSWASAAWFLTSQCQNARPALQAGGQAGFEAYMSCVGTSVTDDRLAYWTRAQAAFGLS